MTNRHNTDYDRKFGVVASKVRGFARQIVSEIFGTIYLTRKKQQQMRWPKKTFYPVSIYQPTVNNYIRSNETRHSKQRSRSFTDNVQRQMLGHTL